MSEHQLTRLQAIIQSMIEDSVTFEEEAIREVGGRKLLAFVDRGSYRTILALNELYINKLIEYLETEEGDAKQIADIDFLADYVTNKYPLRAKIVDFMAKIRQALMSD